MCLLTFEEEPREEADSKFRNMGRRRFTIKGHLWDKEGAHRALSLTKTKFAPQKERWCQLVDGVHLDLADTDLHLAQGW